MKQTSPHVALTVTALIGVIYITVQLRLPALSSLPAVWQLAMAFAVVLPLTWIVVAKFRSGLAVFLVFLAGVAAGVIIDAFLDSKERNLFPIEVFWWWVIVGPACAVGALLGTMMGRSKIVT